MLVAEDHYAEGSIGERVATALCGKGILVWRAAVTSVAGSDKAGVLSETDGLSGSRLAERRRNILAQEAGWPGFSVLLQGGGDR